MMVAAQIESVMDAESEEDRSRIHHKRNRRGRSVINRTRWPWSWRVAVKLIAAVIPNNFGTGNRCGRSQTKSDSDNSHCDRQSDFLPGHRCPLQLINSRIEHGDRHEVVVRTRITRIGTMGDWP